MVRNPLYYVSGAGLQVLLDAYSLAEPSEPALQRRTYAAAPVAASSSLVPALALVALGALLVWALKRSQS